MISPKLYQNSSTYGFFLKILGYEAGIDRFLGSLDSELPLECRILDIGCGTGLMGLHFLERHTNSTLLATDLEPGFLQATLENAEKRSLPHERISVATADVSDPATVTSVEGKSRVLPQGSFDLICMGAVIGYAGDTESSVRQIVGLLAPGGTLINLEMSESLTGRYVSRRYHYDNISLSRMESVLKESGCEVRQLKLRMTHLPAKFTRTAVIAKKPS